MQSSSRVSLLFAAQLYTVFSIRVLVNETKDGTIEMCLMDLLNIYGKDLLIHYPTSTP